MAQIFLTTSGNFSAPLNWPGQADKIECIGAGGNGAAGTTALGGAGGGGGEYASETGALTLANGTAYTVGTAGGATLTSIVAGGITISAHPGGNASGATAGAAGTGSTNTVHRNGGTGGTGSAAASRPGAGGGGAGGPVAAGANGGNSAASNGFKGSGGGGDGSATSSAGTAGTSATAGGVGGSPDGGAGGNGLAAAGTATAGSASASALNFDAAHGVSGGGGGGGGNSSSSGTRNGGAGGAGGPTTNYGYGGGGGGGGAGATAGGAAGAGEFGLIVITYTPVATAYYVDNSAGSDSNPGTLASPWASVTPVNAGVYYAGDTINFQGGQTFAGTPIAQTWSTTQKNAGSTLSNGNLTASCNNATSNNYPGFALAGATTGKYYWEVVVNFSTGGNQLQIGIGNTATSTTTGQYLGIGTDTIGYGANGVLGYGSTTITVGTFVSGNRICFALDLVNKALWVRVGTTGNWNNNASNNPATNTGGFAIPSTVYASPVVPAYNLCNNTIPDNVVASFSSASWAGAAPSGFVSMDGLATTPAGISLTTSNWGSSPAPSSGTPVTFQSYGTGTATISSGSITGFLAVNLPGVAINNLNFTGSGIAANTADGIHIQNNQSGNTQLSGCSIANSVVTGYGFHGIWIDGANGNSGFATVSITGCNVHDNTGGTGSVGTSGISVNGAGYISGTPCHGTVTISSCTVSNNTGSTGNTNWSGSGIQCGECNNVLMDRCRTTNNGANSNNSSGGGPCGTMIVDCFAFTVTRCESDHNHTGNTHDGCGFNCDTNNGGAGLLAYCYAHDNDGIGYLFDYYLGTNVPTMRYCIGQNNAQNGSVSNNAEVTISFVSSQAVTFNMYNCTFYSAKPIIIYWVGSGGSLASLTGRINNNIFYSASGGSFVGTPLAGGVTGNPTGFIFDGNDYFAAGSFSLWWNGTTYTSLASWKSAFTNQETVNGGFTSNPQLTSPGGGGTVGGYAPPQPTAYLLSKTSPMIGAGINLNTQFSINPGPQDYYGTAIPHGVGTGYNVGADGSSSSVCRPGSLAMMGVGCGIWAAKKIEENPVVTRRGLVGLDVRRWR